MNSDTVYHELRSGPGWQVTRQADRAKGPKVACFLGEMVFYVECARMADDRMLPVNQSLNGLVTPGQMPTLLYMIAIPPIVATLALNEYGLYEDSNGKGCEKSLRSIDR